MSKKPAIKESLSEENSDAPVRRSTRNSVNPTSTNSPAPKSIGTRRGSANSIIEKKKPQNADSNPVELAGRRKTRRTSTEEDINSTPIKTQRSSISKIIEEDKKVSFSPKTASRKIGSRAASTSPINTSEVPARRTRRSTSASQENEVVEQLPLRRSTRRRSVDTQEDVSNEEVLTKSKPTPRRRRSNSVDENEETSKNDVKSKTKRLYSEDNQLEPIEEHETEVTEKSERKTDETVVKMKRDNNLSVIEESEDTVQKDSNKVIEDIDNMLTDMISTPKPETVTEKITTRSIFSPMTPKPILSEENTDADCEIISIDSDTENELPTTRQNENMKIIPKSDSLKNTSPLKNQSKQESDKETRKTPLSSAKSNKIDNSIKENFITNGSDDSFTLNSSKILNKIETSNTETDEDVFTSPGSNKENNCISVPPKKNENRVVLKEKESSELSDSDVQDDVFASKTSLINDDEPMEVDCEDGNVEDRSKMNKTDCSDEESKMLSFDKTEQNDMKEHGQKDSEMRVQEVISSSDTNGITETKDISVNTSKYESSKQSFGRSSENVINKNEVESNTPLEDTGNDASCSSTKSNLEVENSFTSLNSNDDNKLDSSFNVFKSPKVYSKQKNSLTSSPGKCVDIITNKKESKDGSSVSSDFSLQMIDSDEEDEAGKERESVGEQNSNTSKQSQVQIEGNSISESETTISANTNTSMRESETEVGIEEDNNDVATKELVEEVVTDSPKKKSKFHQPILEENSLSSNENAIKDSTPLLKHKINSRKSESKLNEFEKSNPIGKSPQQSFNSKSLDDGDLEVKGVKCEKNSPKIISSPFNKQAHKQCAEQSDIEQSITESKPISSLKVNVIHEIKVSNNIVTELEYSKDSSLSDTYCKNKSKPTHSLNSDLLEINSHVEFQQVEDELIVSEQKPDFLNESFASEESETEKRHERSKLNDSLTIKRNKIKKKREIDEINACEEIESSEDGNRIEKIVDITEDNTKTTNVELENQKKKFNHESKQDDGEKKGPISDVKSKKNKRSLRIDDRNSKVSDEITSARSCDISLSESDVETDSTKRKSNRASKIENESSEMHISPLKSKIEKMKACGVNFVNPSPTATKIKLDEKTSKKLDDYLNEKFSTLQNEEQESQSDENKSEDENESIDDHNSSQFLDDMAEEGEEDTPSEGCNDIVDEGESINSKDSEIDSDDTYDSNDSFLVKDDGDDLDLLPGDEYDLGDTPDSTKKVSKKRKRIVRNLNLSSEEEESTLSSRVSFSDKVEVIPEKKSPIKQISPINITDKANKNENNFHKDFQDQESLKEEPNMEIPSIFVDLINDSSEDERTASKQNETPAFDETIRSLIEDEKSSTPNASFNETSNTSKQNNSLRSSSIIIHENVNINEIKEGLLTEKLQQVVTVFCAGIRSSDGNISMNVSLDYVENPSKDCDIKKDNEVGQALKSPVGGKTDAKSRHSFNKSADNNDSVNRKNSRKRKLSNISPKKIQNEPSLNNDFIEEIPVEDLSVLNASFNDETSILDENSRMIDSGSAKKKRRSSTRKEKQLCNKNIVISDISIENDEEAAKIEEKTNKFEESFSNTEELQVSTTKKRRRSSNKIEKPLNENLEKSLGKEDFTENKVEDNSDHDQTKHKSYISPSIIEKRESKHSNCEQRLNIVNDITDDESEPVKKIKKHNKRKCVEKSSKKVLPEIVTSKRQQLVKMQYEELSANDLRRKLPSFKETPEESNIALKKKKLKRLQSDLRRDLKRTLTTGLVTDVKNRPRRMLKPSIEMDAKDWLIEETTSKPSSANLLKPSFNFNKIDAKDFKNQILYDPRIKREPTSAFLRKKGHYY